MKKFLIPLLLAIGLLPQLVGAQTHYNVTVGAATTTSSSVPTNAYYNYSFAQFIYHANEVGLDGVVDTLKFHVDRVSTSRTLTIYMAETSHSTFSSGSDALGASYFQQVFSGSVTFNPGWTTIPLDSTFAYQDTADLVICVIDATGSYVNPYTYFSGQDMAGGYRSVYDYRDGSPYSLSPLPEDLDASYFLPMIQLGMTSNSLYCAMPSNVAVSGITSDGVTVSWHENGIATSWELVISDTAVTDFSMVSPYYPTDTTYTVYGLDPDTHYYVYVRAACSPVDFSGWAGPAVFRTACSGAQTVPYSTGFEGLATGELPSCWRRVVAGTSVAGTFPAAYAYSGNARNSSVYFEFESNNYETEIVALPEMEDISQLVLSFYASVMNVNFVLEAGVMEDTTFVPVDTVQLTAGSGNNWAGSYYPYTIYYNNYTGTGNRIALRVTTSEGSYTLMMDDLTVDYMPTCPPPTHLTASYVASDTVVLEWQPIGSESMWLVTDGRGFSDVAYDTTYMFESLQPATNYTFSVYALCSDGDTSTATSLSVRTNCSEWGPLPLYEDFSSYASSSFPDCWTRIQNTNSYPYITTDYGHCIKSGGQASSITPRMPAPLNHLFVEFDLRREGTSSGNMEFGYTRDPNSVDSMVVIATIYPANTGQYYHYEYDLSNDTCTDSVYLVWHQAGTSAVWYYWLDNVSVSMASDCPAVENLRCNMHTNNEASITWTDTSSSHTDVMLYIGTTNDMASVFDSVTVFAGTTSHIFTDLSGNTHYYVWAKANCSYESSRVIMCEFTTDVDCAPVENLRVVATDYHAFGLNWEAPTAGEPATEYIVSYKPASESTWTSDTVSTLYHYVSGLDTNTEYQYRVSSICDTLSSATVSGTLYTLGCGSMVTNGGTTYSYLPTYIYYGYSYTQQIYLDGEIDSSLDTISSIAFYATSNVSSRNVQLYMGNTNQSSFTSTSNYIPVDSLQLVYTGTLAGSGWITLHLDSAFVRTPGRNLVLATDDNTGSWVSSVPFGATSASNRAIYFYQDGSDINPSSPSASSSSRVSYVNQIKLAGPTCVIPDCSTPVVMVAGAYATQIDVVWNTDPGAVYTVEYSREGTDVWVVADSANTLGSYSLTGLLAGFNYTVRVSTDCAGTILTGSVQTATICAPVALPYTEDFESLTGNYSRNCWYTGTTNLGTTYPYPTVVNLTGDPNKLLLLYNGAYIILPEMDAPLNQLQIRFNFVQGGDNVRLIMGVMDDPTAPIATIHPIDTLIRSNIDTSSAYVYVTYPLSGIDVTSGHLTFWDAFNDNYSFLDNIVVEYIPSCTSVQEVSATATTTGATVSWTTSGATATSFLVEYGPRGFVAGTGTVQAAASSPATITGLNHSTSYDVYVYAICAGTGDTSAASQVARFTTECGAITALPYVQNFENIVEPGSTATNIVPNCWASKVLPAGAGSNQPHVYYNTNTAQAPSQQYCLVFEGVGIAALPEMGVPLDSLCIRFHEWNGDPANYGLIIGAVDNADTNFEASFEPIDTIPFMGNGNEFNVVSFLNGYTGNGNRIAIASYNAAGNTTATHYIDNLTIDRIPNCIAPQRVHTTLVTNVSADLAWTFSNAPNYSIEYGVHGFTPGTGTTVTSATESVSLTGLNPLTQYDVYLVSQCSATETSDTTLFTFTTLRAAPVTTLPYVCTFADSAMAAGWEPVNGSQANQWHVGTAAYCGTADNYAMYISDDNGTSNAYNNGSTTFVYTYRTFSLAAGSYYISYNWQANGEGGFDYLRAWLAPGDVDFTAGQLPNGSTSSSSYTSATPAGWISLDGGSKLNLQSSWQTYASEIAITTPGAYHLVFMWANDGSVGTNPPAAIDNVEVYLNTCPAPDSVTVSNVTASTADIDWANQASAAAWQIDYGPQGHIRGTGTIVNAASHPVTLTGLTSMTSYDVYVRSICSGADTGRWSLLPVAFTTAMCDDVQMIVNYDSTMSSTTSSYSPIGYSAFNYSYVQTIIDSAYLAGLDGDITAFSFVPASTSAGTYFTNMSVYMANVSESDLSSGFIHPDSSHAFVQVINNANFNYSTTTMQLHSFDTAFTWDGHSNVLFAVNRQHGSWTSGSSFQAHNASAEKMRYEYNDGSAYDINTVSGGTASSTVGDITLYSCGSEGCRKPVITSVTHDYESATVTWSGTGANYEVNIKPALDMAWPSTDIAVTGNSYTFTGLMPATQYTFRVRQDCTADSLGYSDWTIDGVLTDSLPCLSPDSLHVTASTNATATFDWNVRGNETAWDIHVWFTGGLDSIYTVTTRPATVGGFAAGLTYNAAIRPLCGSAHNIVGEWGDTITFSTTVCPNVTGLTASNVTANSVTLSWTANPMAQSWIIEYGYEGFDQGTGTTVPSANNTYVINGLTDDSPYDFYVRAVCGTDWVSENWALVNTRTQEGGVVCDAPTNVSTTVADNSVTVSWTAGTGNISYEIEYGIHGFGHGSGTFTNAATSPAVIPNLEYETTYDLYVRAVCDQNTNSTWSTVATFTTGARPSEDCNPVTNLTVSDITDTTATVSWTPAPGTDSWQVVVADQYGNDIADVMWDEPVIGITRLTPGTAYIVKVRTACGDDNFSAYVTANFRTTGGVGIDDATSVACTIYPNPATSSATISVSGVNGKVKIDVVDMNGRVVATETLECNTDCVKTMDVDRLAQGAYFVRITGETVNMVKKLIVR